MDTGYWVLLFCFFSCSMVRCQPTTDPEKTVLMDSHVDSIVNKIDALIQVTKGQEQKIEILSRLVKAQDQKIATLTNNVLSQRQVFSINKQTQGVCARRLQEAPTVVTFNYPRSSRTYLRFLGRVPSLTQFSLCFWFHLDLTYTGEHFIFSYSASSGYTNGLLVGFSRPKSQRLIFTYVMNKLMTYRARPGDFDSPTWYCSTWQKAGGTAKLYLNGTKVKDDSIASRKTIPAGGHLYLGQEQDAHGGGFDVNQAFIGSFSNLNLWDRVLTDQEIADISSCNSSDTGNVISWKSWQQYFEVERAVVTDEDICK